MIDFTAIERWVHRARAAQEIADFTIGVAEVVNAPGTALLIVRDVGDTVEAARASHRRGEAQWRDRWGDGEWAQWEADLDAAPALDDPTVLDLGTEDYSYDE